MGNGLSCREKFAKFLKLTEPEAKTAVFPLSCAQPTGKRFAANQCHPWKAKWEPQTLEKFWVQKNYFISLFDVEKFAEFSGTIIFQILSKWLRYHEKTDFGAYIELNIKTLLVLSNI